MAPAAPAAPGVKAGIASVGAVATKWAEPLGPRVTEAMGDLMALEVPLREQVCTPTGTAERSTKLPSPATLPSGEAEGAGHLLLLAAGGARVSAATGPPAPVSAVKRAPEVMGAEAATGPMPALAARAGMHKAEPCIPLTTP